MGSRAVLVEDPPGDPAGWGLGLRELELEGIVDIVPAARTVLVTCATDQYLTAMIGRLPEVSVSADSVTTRATVVIPTRYEGPDLDAVAAATGLTTDDVADRHAAAIYRVAFCGFAPGFGYLRGVPDELRLPRHATPRQRVPAGSVAIAAEYTAVYPTASPGGWHLIGRTDRRMFDVHATPPAVLQPGSTVRFERV